jgi:hypothetical protein
MSNKNLIHIFAALYIISIKMSSKKQKYERVICEGIPFFKDSTGKLYLWENNGTVLHSPFHIGQISDCGEQIIFAREEKDEKVCTKDDGTCNCRGCALETKLRIWREHQSSRTREQIRRPDAIATINPGAITVDEAAATKTGESETADEPVKKRRTRRSTAAETTDADPPKRKRRTTKAIAAAAESS